jgi:hypothetical protein
LEYLEELADAQHDRSRRNLAHRMRDQVMAAVRLGNADWVKFGAFDDLIEAQSRASGARSAGIASRCHDPRPR